MKVLIIWAHPEVRSLTQALAATAQNVLLDAGHAVRVTDLYREGFVAVASDRDFRRRHEPDRLVYDAEQLAAAKGNGFDPEIEKAIEDLLWCDQLILQFPLWWFSVPAIMKGWIDRVMAKGVAYGGGRWYDRGGFAGRRAMLSLTTAAYPQMCSSNGINGSMDIILWPLQQGVLRFCGFDALAPNIIWSAPYMAAADRLAAIERYRERLIGLATEPAEPAHRRQDFDENWQLRPGVERLTVGHRVMDER